MDAIIITDDEVLDQLQILNISVSPRIFKNIVQIIHKPLDKYITK